MKHKASSFRAKLRTALMAPMTLLALGSETATRGLPVEPEVVNTKYFPSLSSIKVHRSPSGRMLS